MEPVITFGLTGSIAMGKSTVANTFVANGIPTVDADLLARQVVAIGTQGLQSLVEAFGTDYLLLDGTLDRPKLGKMIFSDTTALQTLNSILHPLIQTEAAKQIQDLHNGGSPIVGYNFALLNQSHKEKYYPLIIVHCTPEQQLERLIKRGTGHGSLTTEQAQAIINNQTSVQDKLALADFTIDSSGTIEHSVKQTENVILCLKVLLRDKQMIAEGKR